MQQAVIFVRVSEKEQDYLRQVEDLRAVAQNQAVQVVAEIAEKVSGAKRNQEREGIQRLLELSRQGVVQKVFGERSLAPGPLHGRSPANRRRANPARRQHLRPKLWYRNSQKR